MPLPRSVSITVTNVPKFDALSPRISARVMPVAAVLARMVAARSASGSGSESQRMVSSGLMVTVILTLTIVIH